MKKLSENLTEEELDKATNMLKAIAHPLRLAIINLLQDGKNLTVSEIHNILDLEQSTTSHHLGILKDKGIVNAKRKGKNTFYCLRHDRLSTLISCIKMCAKPQD